MAEATFVPLGRPQMALPPFLPRVLSWLSNPASSQRGAAAPKPEEPGVGAGMAAPGPLQ